MLFYRLLYNNGSDCLKKYMGLEDMINANCSTVLHIIQQKGSVSRKEITEISGLSWGGMTKIVNRLLEKGYITETKSDKSVASGRTPGFLSVNTETNFVIGIDINLTGLNAVVMDMKGKELKHFSSPPPSKSREEFLSEIISFIHSIFNHFSHASVLSVCIAMQGIVDHKKGISVKFPDVCDWENVPIKQILEDEFNTIVFVEHDPDCLLYPHLTQDSKENTVLLRIDKSIGMAVALYGKNIKGEGIFEIAHNIVIPNGRECSCGQKGCLQAYIDLCTEYPNSVDELSVRKLIFPLSVAIKNISNIFCAHKIILTGALIEHKHLFKKPLTEELKKISCNTAIEFSEFSQCAERGAALIAIDKSIQTLNI